jgi:SAM-dependent MidA family methyltransferase
MILPPVKDQIVEVIRAEGPIPFERFMDLALYGPTGFFATSTLRSQRSGDFLTSPEVSPLFGETLARFVEGENRRIGEPFTLVEVAGGSGSLLRPLLGVTPVSAWAVEVSPPARQALAALVGPERVVASMEAVPDPIRGVVLANEFVDNLPMAIAQLDDAGWRERWVAVEGGGLVLVDAFPRPEVEEWLARWAGTSEVGAWVEVQLAAAAWLETVLERLVAGSVVVIDYGDTMENLVPRRRDGTLRTYRAHHLGPHPLDEPGATDITADVNFTALMDVAERCGASVRLFRQDDFLADLGLRDHLSDLRKRELELARSGDEMERLRVRTLKNEVETLLHPRGLGDFRVMVARKG